MTSSIRRSRHLAIASTPVPHEPDPLTVATFLEEWLWAKQSLRASTHRSYETHVRIYLTPYLGDVPLDGLRAPHIERMFRELALRETERPLSVATVRRIHATLMSALNLAVRRGLIERNPAATVELPRAPRARVETWSAQELARFLNAISDDRLHSLYLILGLFGLRRGEVAALRWSDIDLNAGLLRVERSLVRVGGDLVLGPPKSSSGTRVVAIDDETARRLHWHQCRQRMESKKAGATAEPEFVFTTESGDVLDPAYISRRFDRLIAHHGLPRIRLHDLRHTSASIGLAAGESLVEVSRRLGHSSIVLTADTYSHISPLVAKESAERTARTVYHP